VAAILLGLSLCLLLFYHRSFLLTGLVFGICIMLLQLLTPLLNSLGMESINQGKPLNFGIARGAGSGAYAVVASVLGTIAAKTGAISVPVSMIIIYVLFLVFLYRFPFEKTRNTGNSQTAKGSSHPIAFFRKYSRFGIVLLGCILLYVSHVLLNSFTFQIVQSKGGTSSEMGVAMALSAVMEIPTMFLFVYMVKKVRCDIWFRISGIFFTLKTLGTLLAPSILPFYFVQILQLGGWALITVSSVYYVNSIMEEQDAIKGQAYMTMTYTLGSVLGALIGGSLIDLAGVNAMLIFATISSGIGMLIVLLAAQRPKQISEDRTAA
jgi:PPP family 3-phenylpropionic acid transporter